MADPAKRAPRSVPRLIAEAFGLYWRYPLLFLTLAAGVIVPYQLIVLAATGVDQYNRATLSFGISLLLTLVDLTLVDPLISALHVHAVADIEEGLTPRIGAVTRRGLAVLPLVAGAALLAGLAFFGGLLLFVIPGGILFLRLFVAAQAAAIERVRPRRALHRSWSLTESNFVRVLFFFVCIGVITFVPSFLISRAFPHHHTTALAFLVGTALQIIIVSFTALATALLYYDLRRRRELGSTT